jgi:hypothetical protein
MARANKINREPVRVCTLALLEGLRTPRPEVLTGDWVGEAWDRQLAGGLAQSLLKVGGKEAGVRGGAHERDTQARVAACMQAKAGG